MNDINEQDIQPEEERRSRKGALLLLLLLAGAVGVGSYYATRMSSMPVAVKKDETAEEAKEPASEPAKATGSPTKPLENSASNQSSASKSETQVSASASTQVDVAAQPEKPAEPAKQPAQQATAAEQKPAETETEATVSKLEPEQPVVQAAKQKAVEPEQQIASVANPPPKPEAAQPEAPSFDTVRVEPTGDALIAGRAAPGSEVTVKLNGEMIGKAKANDEGSFVLIPDKPLPEGAGALSLESDVGGKIVSSESTVAVAVKPLAKGEALVAVVKPQEPVAVVQAPTSGSTGKSDKVVLDAVEYDDSGDIVFSGRSNPGNAIRVYVDNALVGEVTASVEGRWTFNGKSAIAPGTHSLRADEIGQDGKVVSRVELPFLREEPTKVATSETQSDTAAQPVSAEQGIGVVANKGNAAVPQRIVIQPGNNLWRLSRLVYGRGTRYTVIYEANKDQIRNPDLIYPGQVFAMPITP